MFGTTSCLVIKVVILCMNMDNHNQCLYSSAIVESILVLTLKVEFNYMSLTCIFVH